MTGQTDPLVLIHSRMVAASYTSPLDLHFMGSFMTCPLIAHRNSLGIDGSALASLPLLRVSFDSALMFILGALAAFSTRFIDRAISTFFFCVVLSGPNDGRSPRRRYLAASSYCNGNVIVMVMVVVVVMVMIMVIVMVMVAVMVMVIVLVMVMVMVMMVVVVVMVM